MKTETAPPNVQVIWRLPEGLVDDCQIRDRGGHWAEGFRKLLQRAADNELRVKALPPEGRSVSKAISLPSGVNLYLEEEAERLSQETGKAWSAMQVAREIWRQSNRKRRAS